MSRRTARALPVDFVVTTTIAALEVEMHELVVRLATNRSGRGTIVTSSEAARILDVTDRQIRKLAQKGTLPKIRVPATASNRAEHRFGLADVLDYRDTQRKR